MTMEGWGEMDIISWIALIIICYILIRSIVKFIRGKNVRAYMERSGSYFSAELFYTLLVIYSIVIIGFALIYFILSFQHITLVENGELRQVNTIGTLIHSLYFSGVTLLTIGYGDITPIGIGRLIALIEAMIGYILPTAFVLRLVQTNQRDREQ
ncbi:potassium channel family protein [Oceanobacillus halotolerans]|uniref:potassium channel family protein n=1 Tax=Oceanobacillus halotolerans TaxID=2663380 RepID=UPI001CF7E719|nr:potassium channel family protein [Oceanobacillus halotolerans]